MRRRPPLGALLLLLCCGGWAETTEQASVGHGRSLRMLQQSRPPPGPPPGRAPKPPKAPSQCPPPPPCAAQSDGGGWGSVFGTLLIGLLVGALGAEWNRTRTAEEREGGHMVENPISTKRGDVEQPGPPPELLSGAQLHGASNEDVEEEEGGERLAEMAEPEPEPEPVDISRFNARSVRRRMSLAVGDTLSHIGLAKAMESAGSPDSDEEKEQAEGGDGTIQEGDEEEDDDAEEEGEGEGADQFEIEMEVQAEDGGTERKSVPVSTAETMGEVKRRLSIGMGFTPEQMATLLGAGTPKPCFLLRSRGSCSK